MIPGLNLAAQLKMKSKSQSTESIQGNDLIFRCVGETLEKSQNSWSYLTLQKGHFINHEEA